MSNNEPKLTVFSTFNEQGSDFKEILITAIKSADLIQKQIVVKQKEDENV